MLTFGSLFAGIGGLDLGLERAGMQCKWQVEIDEFCLKVLEKHWPNVKRFKDIKDCDEHNLESVDLICGGFPCQPVSVAGKKKAQADIRWLWPEFHRIIHLLRPRYALVENVPGLLSVNYGRAMAEILGDLAESGFDAEWQMLPASAFGAPHIRNRCFVLAYPSTFRRQILGDAKLSIGKESLRNWSSDYGLSCLDAWDRSEVCPPASVRMADGLPFRVERIGALGNAVVPQVAEYVGRQIIASCRTG